MDENLLFDELCCECPNVETKNEWNRKYTCNIAHKQVEGYDFCTVYLTCVKECPEITKVVKMVSTLEEMANHTPYICRAKQYCDVHLGDKCKILEGKKVDG